MNLIAIAGLTLAVAGSVADSGMVVHATSISQMQNQINQTQNKLDDINEEIERISDEQALVEEKIADLNAEIINTMTSIGMKEDEIAGKEAELSNKQVEIDKTQKEYEEAKAREEKQYEDMLVQIKFMYENSSSTYLGLFLEGEGLSGMLNRMDFIEKIYSYSKKKLKEYEATKNQVHELWDLLEVEKAQLEQDKKQLEEDRAVLKAQKTNLDGMLAKKKQESSNYEAELKKAKQEASVAKKLLQQEKQQLKKLQQQQAQQNKNQGSAQKGGNTAAANGTYTTTNYTSTIDNAAGSDLGKKVAKYACQYIGNPYVAGGTSLTNGADCSGFTFRVYSDFGYSLPRTSYEQRSAGKGVSYSEAQPGDLICYDGHVAIYIGGGKIVHASSAKTGIKVSNAEYRTILAVRRII